MRKDLYSLTLLVEINKKNLSLVIVRIPLSKKLVQCLINLAFRFNVLQRYLNKPKITLLDTYSFTKEFNKFNIYYNLPDKF